MVGLYNCTSAGGFQILVIQTSIFGCFFLITSHNKNRIGERSKAQTNLTISTIPFTEPFYYSKKLTNCHDRKRFKIDLDG